MIACAHPTGAGRRAVPALGPRHRHGPRLPAGSIAPGPGGTRGHRPWTPAADPLPTRPARWASRARTRVITAYLAAGSPRTLSQPTCGRSARGRTRCRWMFACQGSQGRAATRRHAARNRATSAERSGRSWWKPLRSWTGGRPRPASIDSIPQPVAAGPRLRTKRAGWSLSAWVV